MRTAALFAVPVWLVYVLWSQRALRARRPGGGRRSSCRCSRTRRGTRPRPGASASTQADGWFLYGRVGEIADCGNADIPRDARPLCARNARDRREGAAYHIWNADGPARRVFGGMSRDARRAGALERGPAGLRARDHPRSPGRLRASWSWDDFTALLRRGRRVARQLRPRRAAAAVRPARAANNEIARDRWFPGFVPHVQPPAKRMRDYHETLPHAAARDGSAGAGRGRRAARVRRRGAAAPHAVAAPPGGVPAERRGARDAARHGGDVRVRAALPDPGRPAARLRRRRGVRGPGWRPPCGWWRASLPARTAEPAASRRPASADRRTAPRRRRPSSRRSR